LSQEGCCVVYVHCFSLCPQWHICDRVEQSEDTHASEFIVSLLISLLLLPHHSLFNLIFWFLNAGIMRAFQVGSCCDWQYDL